MGRNPLFWVRALSVISYISMFAYGIHDILSGKTHPMPAYLVYMWIGVLGTLLENALLFQQRRISELEQTLSKRS